MISLSNRIIDETKFIVLYTLMFIFMFRHCAIFITSYMCAADTLSYIYTHVRAKYTEIDMYLLQYTIPNILLIKNQFA